MSIAFEKKIGSAKEGEISSIDAETRQKQARRKFRRLKSKNDLGFDMERSTYWSRWLTIWNVLRPIWPLFVANFFVCVIAFGTDQGREAAKFAMTYSGHYPFVRPIATMLALTWFAISMHEVCLRAITRDYPFSARANPILKTRFIVSFLVSLITPLVFFIFYVNTLVDVSGNDPTIMQGWDFENILFPGFYMDRVLMVLVGAIAVSATYDGFGYYFRHRIVHFSRPIERIALNLFPVLLFVYLGMLAWNFVFAPVFWLLVAMVQSGGMIEEATGRQAARTGTILTAISLVGSACVIKAFHRISVRRHYANFHQFVVFRRWHNWVMGTLFVISLGMAILYLVLPGTMASLFGPVFTLLASVGLLAGIFTLLAILASHHHGFPTIIAVVFLMGLGPVLGPVKFHNVALTEPEEGLSMASDPRLPTHPDLPIMEDAVRLWRESRPSDAPAVVVLAEGGGIRAALHTASLLSCLDETLGGELYDNLFTMSGVSGGAVGVGSYLAARADGLAQHSVMKTGDSWYEKGCNFDLEKRRGEFVATDIMSARNLSEFLQADFFSPALAGLVFRDFPQDISIICVAIDCGFADRAKLFEDAFIKTYRMMGDRRSMKQTQKALAPGYDGDWFAAPFLDVVKVANQRASVTEGGPIVFLNSFDAKSGRPAVVSNVSLESDGWADEANSGGSVYGMTNLLEKMCGGQSISLATAAHLSARFPLVSPPGRLEIDECKTRAEHGVEPVEGERKEAGIGLYVDGGYFDNSGASSSQAALKLLREQDRDQCLNDIADAQNGGVKAIRNCVRPVIVLHIVHRSHAGKDLETRLSPFYEFATPAEAVMAARGVHGDVPIQRLCESAAGRIKAPVGCRKLNGWLADEDLDVTEEEYAQKLIYNRDVVFETWVDADSNTAAPRLIWMRSPLQFAADVDDVGVRLPLGWLLGETGPTILKRVNAHVDRMRASLGCYVRDDYSPDTLVQCQGAALN
ncbi:hypothetical protein [Hirschia litorea]|uniref:PNPLA domain-containing protein n=1 Tax=Hirschia litorea TaxID=1199156 RepID=A0ABW2IMD2_9PROT